MSDRFKDIKPLRTYEFKGKFYIDDENNLFTEDYDGVIRYFGQQISSELDDNGDDEFIHVYNMLTDRTYCIELYEPITDIATEEILKRVSYEV